MAPSVSRLGSRGALVGCLLAAVLPSAGVLPLASAGPGTPPGPSPAATAGSPPATRLIRYASRDPSFTLMKPGDWVVRHERSEHGFRISVASPDATSRVVVEAADNRKQPIGSLALLARQAAAVGVGVDDAGLSEVAACRDSPPSCAVATVDYSERGIAMRGRFYLHADQDIAVARSYHAPAARIAAERTLLLDVLTNIRVQGRQPPNPPLVERRAADGSLSISLPADWAFLGQRGAVIAGAPQGGAGVVFTSFPVFPQSYGVTPPPGVLVSAFVSPERFIHTIFQQFRNRDARVNRVMPDRSTESECLQQIGRRCDAADLHLSWVSPEGVACTGAFKVVNAHPNLAGQWFSIVAGIWGPSSGLAEQLPMLERVAASFAIDDRFAKATIRQGLAQLKVLERQTALKIQGLYRAVEEGQRDYERRTADRERAEARADDYRRGNSYWISDLEGGKVYQTDPWGTRDTRTGDRIDGPPHDYIHFEGQNPRHPSEQMREISSDELRRLNR